MASEDDPSSAIIRPQGDGTDEADERVIILVDHTQSDGEDDALEPHVSKQTSNLAIMSHSLTHGSIRKTMSRRKYQRAKWQEGKDSQATRTGKSSTSLPRASADIPQEQSASDTDAWGEGTVRRKSRKVGQAIGLAKERRQKLETDDPDSHVDVLYENQRGFFLFGMPRFSSRSLFQFDPSAWVDYRFHPSAVNITNAQVPDPSWDWAWRTWYVDMSGDVDEEGWEYSFWFGSSAAWHGTHPWFHSYVRRRRWLRKRVRRKGKKPAEASHALTSDYFTIHSRSRKIVEDTDSMASSQKRNRYAEAATSSAWGAKSWAEQAEMTDLHNVPELLRSLKIAAVDREKIVLFRKFLEHANDELHYLPDNMEHIMKLLVYQNSRRRLLALLMHEFDAAEQHRDEHVQRGEQEDDDEKRHIDYLLKAVEAADDQCRNLEFWSDIKGMARDGELLKASEHTHGWDHGWQGIDTSGAKESGGISQDALESLGSQDKGKRPARDPDENEIFSSAMNGGSHVPESSHADTNSSPREVFFSPPEQSKYLQRLPTPSDTKQQVRNLEADLPVDWSLPSHGSPQSLERYESAHSQPEELDGDSSSGEGTEKALSEDEGEDEGTGDETPPVGATPIEAIANVLGGNGDDGTPKNATQAQEKEDTEGK